MLLLIERDVPDEVERRSVRTIDTRKCPLTGVETERILCVRARSLRCKDLTGVVDRLAECVCCANSQRIIEEVTVVLGLQTMIRRETPVVAGRNRREPLQTTITCVFADECRRNDVCTNLCNASGRQCCRKGG